MNDKRATADAVALAQQGDPQGFAQLYELFSPLPLAIALKMDLNRADADDIRQEAFLRVMQNIGNFRGECAFSSWLYRITRNAVLMHLRRKKRELFDIPLEEHIDDEKRSGSRPRPVPGEADLTSLSTPERIDLERALARLRPEHREVLLLSDLDGCSDKEIAEKLGLSLSNAKSRLNRARRQMRELLTEESEPK